jgi:hypothetical protein
MNGHAVLVSVILGLSGLGFIFVGFITFRSKKITITYGDEDVPIEWRKFTAKKTVAIGWFFILLGIASGFCVLLIALGYFTV